MHLLTANKKYMAENMVGSLRLPLIKTSVSSIICLRTCAYNRVGIPR